MKIASDEHWYTWEQGQFFGSNKPTARVVIFKTPLRESGAFRTLIFGNPAGDEYFEIPQVNLKTLSRNHRVGTDAASMTLVMRNVAPISIGENLDESYDGSTASPTKRQLREQGQPGLFTYRRGLSSDGSNTNPWGHDVTSFTDLFLPNRVIRTFEGYGSDGSTVPWNDSKLLLTGTWLIDRVRIETNGLMTIECRDLAKLLIEQRLYPPIIPLENYPLEFCSDSTTSTIVEGASSSTTTSTTQVVGPNVARHQTDETQWDSSAAPWYGWNDSVYGHRASHAFDNDLSTYWISMRNSQPNADWAYEWIDAICDGEPINRVEFKPWRGGYVLYICVMEDGVWQGSQVVPYNRNAQPAHPNDSDVPYLYRLNMPAGENWYSFELDRFYNADKVRLVFTNLQWFGAIPGGDYRAGVYEFQCYAFTAGTSETVTVVSDDTTVTTDVPGNITDYTDIIKLLVSWAGFYWPNNPALIQPAGTSDPLFMMSEWGGQGGRAWGDFFYSGAYPVSPACIEGAYWDNKSVMDGINQIKEILGFIGYVDATGGFIWRPPNIWANGNYITGVGYRGESSIPIVEERNLLLDYGITVDDAALRSEIVVVSADDPTIYGSYSPGYAVGEESPVSIEGQGMLSGGQVVTDLSLLAGQQRVMLVPDYPFGQDLDDPIAARAEVEKFAYLVALWIHWSYRKGKVRIPANPALDVDDQIRIYEARTSETYIHYILSQAVTLDFDSGSYIADIETHWLGNGPESQWHMFINDLPPALHAYLCQQGILNCDEGGDPGVGGSWAPSLPDVPDTPIVVPRTPSDLTIPYPEPPDVEPVPPDADLEGEAINDPGAASPGTVLNCSNNFMFAYWPGTGPNYSLSSYQQGGYFYGASGSKSYTKLDSRAWPAFKLLEDLFIEEGIYVYTASGKDIRYVGGTTTWSNHSWGTALDVNSGSEGGHYRGKSIYEFPADLRNRYLRVWERSASIRARSADGTWVSVFKWGQLFGTPDPMHWQVCAKAEDCVRGVRNIEDDPPIGPI